MRPADFMVLGAVFLMGGGIACKIELVLGRVGSNELDYSETTFAILICCAGAGLFVAGILKLIL